MDAPTQSAVARDNALSKLPDRFFSLDDVVSQELTDLDYPWNLGIIEERIREYTVFSEEINAQLSARVMRNYNDFVQGMQQVQSVETELTLVGVLIKNGRRKLQERDLGLVRGSMHITRQQRKSERLSRLLATLKEFQGVVQIDTRLRQSVHSENYSEAITQHAALREAISRDQFKQFPGVLGLREGLTLHHELVKQKLSDGLRVAAVSTTFDAERYAEILKAYSRLSSDVAPSVGKELLRHVSECIVSVARQCMLAFSTAPPTDSSPSEWHRKAQLRDLCKTMDPTRFAACTAQLYEYLCDFLYRHQFLCDWHMQRLQVLEKEEGQNPSESGFLNVLRDVLTELSASKRNVWDRIQQQVSLVLMTLDFQYPALTEDSFLHILHLTQLLIEEGDAFMATYQPQGAENRRQWSAPIRNTLRSKAHDYFQTLHFKAFFDFKSAHIEQDTWQRLPVPRSYRLLRTERLRAVPRTSAAASAASQTDASKALSSEPTVQKIRTAENNPFRNYKPEPLLPTGTTEELDSFDARVSRDDNDEIDDHALLQHWIDDSEGLMLEQIGSSMLSNSNRSPVVSSSTAELARILERYFRMMGAVPGLALDIFQSAVQVIEFYVHCVLCLFVQDKQVIMLLDDLEAFTFAPGQPGQDIKLQSRHDTFLLQRTCPDLRRAVMRTREFLSSLALPDACQGPNVGAAGASLMQVQSFPKLTSPSSLCGLAERCVGVESVRTLIGELRDLQQWLSTLLPRGSAQEALERFLPTQDIIASQLRTFVLMCAARDVLEVPDVGRVSLDHFSNTVQALRWDVKDFSAGSPASPYLEQLRAQIDELARRIPCAGGGSMPYATQRLVWGWAQVRLMRECAEVVAKIGKRKSQEALFRLAEDFQLLRDAVGQNFKSPNATEEEPLLPDGHPLVETVSWKYLDIYLEAHGFNTNEALVWCKRHPEYPLRLLKALIEYVSISGNPKVQKQAVTDLEVFFASYISDEQLASSAQRPM